MTVLSRMRSSQEPIELTRLEDPYRLESVRRTNSFKESVFFSHLLCVSKLAQRGVHCWVYHISMHTSAESLYCGSQNGAHWVMSMVA